MKVIGALVENLAGLLLLRGCSVWSQCSARFGAVVVAAALLFVGCASEGDSLVDMLILSEAERYEKNAAVTMAVAHRFASEWKRREVLFHDASGQLAWEQCRDRTLERLENSGFHWCEGKILSLTEVTASMSEARRNDISYVGSLGRSRKWNWGDDAWKTPMEFCLVEGLLAVRSAGADGRFEGSLYARRRFPYPAGDDLVMFDNTTFSEPDMEPFWLGFYL